MLLFVWKNYLLLLAFPVYLVSEQQEEGWVSKVFPLCGGSTPQTKKH